MIQRFPPTGYVLNPAAWAYRMSVRKGLLGGDRLWRMVLLVIVARRLYQRIMGSTPATVAIEELKQGETLILRGVRSRKMPAP